MCDYSELITTINKINSADIYEVTLNPDKVYDDGINPTKHTNVIIEVEGIRQNENLFADKSEKVDEVLLTSFNTYNDQLKEEIRELKEALAKKLLWSYDNISDWFDNSNMSLSDTVKMKLSKDFDLFKQYVLESRDLEDFYNSLDKDVKTNFIKHLQYFGVKILVKYKTEVMTHFKNIVKSEKTITIKKPIVRKIYMPTNIASQCKRDWPRLNIIGLDRRAFDSLSFYV